MLKDYLVEEIHRIRAKLLDDCQGDLDKLLDHYKASEVQDQDRVVNLEDVRQRRRTKRDEP